jgi:iron(III) transport system permease protein
LRNNFSNKTTHPALIFWIVAGWIGFLILPWYGLEDGFLSLDWLFDGYPSDKEYAPAIFLVGQKEKLWLVPLIIPLIGSLFALGRKKSDPSYAKVLILSGAFGFADLILAG